MINHHLYNTSSRHNERDYDSSHNMGRGGRYDNNYAAGENYGSRDNYGSRQNYSQNYGSDYRSDSRRRSEDEGRDLYGTTPLTREYYNDDDHDLSDYERAGYYENASRNRNYDQGSNRGYGHPSGGPQYNREDRYNFQNQDDNYSRNYGQQGHSRQDYAEQGNYHRYNAENSDYEQSRENWNEGRYMSGNRQSYGYEDQGRGERYRNKR